MNSTYGIFRVIKYLAKPAWKHCYGNLVVVANVLKFSCAGNSDMLRKQILLLPWVENIFASRAFEAKVSQVDLATIKTILTSFQCCSSKMFPSNGARKIMANSEDEVKQPRRRSMKRKGGKERYCKVEDR